MTEDKNYKETFPGMFAIGSMVKENRTDKESVVVKKQAVPKKTAKKTVGKKKQTKHSVKPKRTSVTKYAEKLIY